MNLASASTLGELARAGAEFLSVRSVDSPGPDAKLLLAHVLKLSRSTLLARLPDPAPPGAAARFERLLRRRGSRVPLQHLTGIQEFWSLDFEVGPEALIPRPETELLVEETLRACGSVAPRIADIGTGCGNIAVALARALPGARIFATDLSAGALALARRNAARHGVESRIRFFEGDLAAPLEEEVEPGTLDFLISNPPYVAQWDLPGLQPEVRDHDPRMALTPGGDGTALYPLLFAAAARFLRPGGRVLVELPAGGAERISALLRAVPELEWLAISLDLSRIPRVLLARRR